MLRFFFNDTATTEIYTLSLHDALPIYRVRTAAKSLPYLALARSSNSSTVAASKASRRSEEHTSELQSRGHLVCRLLLEKKKKKNTQVSKHTKIKTPVRLQYIKHHKRPK